jgi:hypothetical protein
MGVLRSTCPGLASSHNPTDLSFPSNRDYRCEPLAPSLQLVLLAVCHSNSPDFSCQPARLPSSTTAASSFLPLGAGLPEVLPALLQHQIRLFASLNHHIHPLLLSVPLSWFPTCFPASSLTPFLIEQSCLLKMYSKAFCFSVLGFELRALHLLGRWS